MNISKLVAGAMLIAAAGSALAEASYPPELPFVSSKTRAEVIAELKQARDDGSLNYAASAYPVLRPVASTTTRAEVKAELKSDTPVANRELDELRDNLGH
ncbi:uncharacterized protein DUF4148 [Collimonas sp. PA-H2]|uniref:DUF4148 domain-containing protein n=1 Tax=Collimonas sp. PA-H2 TaxID=1881062 RepID=UPI000BF65EF4|nr:DUF4148 domain-containing protein [Collimonas sp. PA-H2]PFH10020.1 uncharacterized protein DUF4148 [Collimonas sp. PA-H2]